MPRATRRAPWAVLPAALLLAACGSAGDDTAAGSGAGSGSADAAAERVVEHAYGSTEVPADPQRVIALGWSDVENALALGVTPVGFRDWFGAGLNPWAAELAEGEPFSVETPEDGFLYEEILSLEPDLIFANDGMTEAAYDRLSDIAPTVGPIEGGDSYGVPWDTALLCTGEILGREDDAREFVGDVEARIEEVREAHPEYAGVQVGMGFPPGAGGQPALATSADPRFQTLLNIGLSPSDAVVALDEQGETGAVEFGLEELDRFEADLLLLYSYTDEVRTEALAMPAFAALDVVREDRVIWMPSDVADALTFGTALSIDYVLEKLPPLIAEKLPPA